MELSICTDVYADLSYTEMLDKVKSLGVNAVEMTAGGWGAQKHCPTQKLLADDNAVKEYLAELEKRDMTIAALNCSCNPLWPSETGEKFSQSMYDCVLLAEKLGIKKLFVWQACQPAVKRILYQTGSPQRFLGRIIQHRLTNISGKSPSTGGKSLLLFVRNMV